MAEAEKKMNTMKQNHHDYIAIEQSLTLLSVILAAPTDVFNKMGKQ